ncbi:SUN domain-containing ossification factor-like, partial [Mizuhopecten yessoensis]|uniref:SUN domain-containing ossification factor-like n=1 Tax=Mizuhopecten yessoensis TaxID=6573 RepID=UPI000B458886
SVIKMVKKVLNVGDKSTKEDLGLNDTVHTNDTETSTVTGALLSDNMTSDGYMLPCVQDLREKDVSKQSSSVDQPNMPIPGDTGTSTKSSTPQGTEERSGAVDDQSASIVTKLEDHEQVPSSQDERPIVTLLDREESDVPLLDLVNKCLTKTPRQKVGSKKKLNSTKRASVFCTYVQILLRNSLPGTCTLKRIPPGVRPDLGGQDIDSHSSERKVSADNSFIIVTKDVLSEASNTTGSNSTQPIPPSQSASSLSVHNNESIDTSVQLDITVDTSSQLSSPTPDKSVVEVVMPTVSVPVATEAAISIEPSKVLPHEEVSVTVNPVTVEKTQSSQVTSQKTLTPGEVTLDPSIVSASAQVDTSQTTPALDSVTLVRSQVEESKPFDTTINQPVGSLDSSENNQNQNAEMEMSSSTTEIVSTKVTMTKDQPNASDNLEIFDNDAEVMSSIVDKLASAILDDPENGHSRIINDTVLAENATQKSSGMPQKDLGLVNVKVPVLSYSKREIALMRLANRINALEMNVTLSIRFLERMSQKFKTKSDEMIKTLNKTDTKLEETALEAKVKGKEQDEHMKNMEIRLRNLTVMMEEMVHSMDTLNQKVTDRQMVWTSVEVFILIVIFMVCLKRGKSTPYIPVSPEVQKLLQIFPSEMDLTALPRRNSFHGTIQHNSAELAMGSLQRYNSETALACKWQDISSFDPGGTTKDSSGISQQKDMPKRKKRKKKGPEVKICDVPSSSDFKDDLALTESHTNFNSAGLLFGASPEETTVCEKLNRTSSQSCKWNFNSDNKLVCQPEVDSAYCKSTYSDTSVNSKGQGSKVRVTCSSNDIQGSVPGGNRFKVKAHSFTNELPVSVISSKPPKCPGVPQGGVKSRRGSPPMTRALADPGGGGGGAAKKKRQNFGHSIPSDNSSQTPAEIETIRPNVNGNHVSTSLCVSQQHRPKKKSHMRASSADLSSSSRVDTSATSWKKLIGWK